GFLLTAAYMVTCGVIFFFGRRALIGIFTHDPEVLRQGAMMMIFAAVYQLADALYISYNGALRGAGDTFVPAVALAVLNWSMSVGLGLFIAKRFPQWGVAGPWAVTTIYGITLSLFLYVRFRRGGWQRIHLEQPAPIDTVTTAAPASAI